MTLRHTNEYPTPPDDNSSPTSNTNNNDETNSNLNYFHNNHNVFPNYNDYVNEFNRYFYANNLANLTPYNFQQNLAYYDHMNSNQFSFYDNQNFMPKSTNNESFHTLPISLEQQSPPLEQLQQQSNLQTQPQPLSYSMDRIIEQEQKSTLLLNKEEEESEPSSPQNDSATREEKFHESEQNATIIKNEVNIKPKSNEINEAKYLMQPPDSESIAAAAATASINRTKRRTRTKFDKHQIDVLEATFQRTQYPDVNIVDRLGTILNLTTERISVWFQNRRARYKRTKKDSSTTLTKQQLEQNNLLLSEVLKTDLDRSGDTNQNESNSNSSSRASTPATLPNETNMYLNYYQQASYNPNNPLFKPNIQPYVN